MFPPHGQKYPTDPDQIIHAKTMTVRELLGQGDLGLIVPRQHHQFTWDAEQVSRLVRDICSFELHDSFPCQKPILIHGQLDCWNRHDNVYGEYHSAISSYLGQFFLAWATDKSSPPEHSSSSLASHLDAIDHGLDVVMRAHYIRTEMYPNAWQIRSGMHPLDWRHFNLSEVATAVGTAVDNDFSTESKICAFIQLYAFSHALLHRCCFAVIMPTTERAMRNILDARNCELDLDKAG